MSGQLVGSIAQLGERLLCKQRVERSSRSGSTTQYRCPGQREPGLVNWQTNGLQIRDWSFESTTRCFALQAHMDVHEHGKLEVARSNRVGGSVGELSEW